MRSADCVWLRPLVFTNTFAFICICAWIWTCHWSGTEYPGELIIASSFSGDGCEASTCAVRAVRWEPVAAFGGANDRATRLHDFGGGRHALDGLIQILIEREPRVGREDDVEGRLDGLHGFALAAWQAARARRTDRRQIRR